MTVSHPPHRPSPLTRAELASIRRPFRGARLLPGWAYHDPAFLDFEREEWFFRDWVAVARAEELSDPGSFVLRDYFGESVLLVRGADDVISAFYNVCRMPATRRRRGASTTTSSGRT